jgi:hypothetical protein
MRVLEDIVAMRIVNPTFGTATATAEAVTDGKVDWMNDPIIMFSNNKPNARELFDGLRTRLGTIRRIDNVDFIAKPSASVPARPEVIDDIARKYRIALLALGD